MKNSEFVSRVINGIRALNKDEHISKRYVLHIGRNKSRFLISQKLNDKSLFREDNLFETIRCFPMKKDDIVSCNIVAFRRCKSLMKSKHKIPELIYSKYGSSIIGVYSIDGGITFTPTTLTNYSLLKDRPNSKFISKYMYYIQDGYLYLPDSDIEAVDIVLITLENDVADEVSECNTENQCKSLWDYDFKCPDKLLEVVIQETLQEVLGTFRKIVPDENPNMDETLRGKTTL